MKIQEILQEMIGKDIVLRRYDGEDAYSVTFLERAINRDRSTILEVNEELLGVRDHINGRESLRYVSIKYIREISLPSEETFSSFNR